MIQVSRGPSLKKKQHSSPPFDVITDCTEDKCVISGADKPYIIQVSTPPLCSDQCPAGINVKSYIRLIANRKFEEAVDLIRQANPFPAVCGRICTRPCEEFCELGKTGDPIAIRELKRYAAEYELARRPLTSEPCPCTSEDKVAIIGSGPAGLTAAVDLIRLGYPVTVFEEKPLPGGMLRYGIPSYRLPTRILNKDIEWITGLGVTITPNTKINDPASLLSKGYAAVLIAGGAPKSFTLGIQGEDADGVIDALWFLEQINSKQDITLSGTVVVIGGGSTAFDVARSAQRIGAENVSIAYRRSIEEMPADAEEIQEAQDEGITLQTQVIPTRILKKKKQVSGIEFIKTKLGDPDTTGRRTPHPIPNSEFVVDAEFIIPAVGAMPNVGLVGGVKVTTKKGVIDVSSYGKTPIDGIYAAGDVEMGPSSVVEAIGRGHLAAQGIHAYLQSIPLEELHSTPLLIPIVRERKKHSLAAYTKKKHLDTAKVLTFTDTTCSLTDFEAVEEASRCFTCGPCQSCPTCLPNCSNKQLCAQIDERDYLLKVPRPLSAEITHKGSQQLPVRCNEQHTTIRLETLTAQVNQELCLGCGRCEELCAYRAIQNKIIKGKRTTSLVNHDACSSCSACVSSCPSGAISQGYMSDQHILSRIARQPTPYKGVKALMSFWHTPAPTFGDIAGVIELMSVRKISPTFLIQALITAGRGLCIIGPKEPGASHYLPWEEPPHQVIKKTHILLKSIGISPDRIRYIPTSTVLDPAHVLKKYAQELEKRHLDHLQCPIPTDDLSPLGKTMILMRILATKPDVKPSPSHSTSKSKGKNTLAVFEGCIPLLDSIGRANHLFDLTDLRTALHSLLQDCSISYSLITDLRCPSAGLLDLDLPEKTKIVQSIFQYNTKLLIKHKSKDLLLITPESYASFLHEDYPISIRSLPQYLIDTKKLKNLKAPYPITVALHPACAMQNDPFLHPTQQLLDSIPNVTTVLLTSPCQHTHFSALTGESKLAAIHLMEEAKRLQADMVVCTSPYCHSHLLLSQRIGSWRPVEIPITDLASFLCRCGGDK